MCVRKLMTWASQRSVNHNRATLTHFYTGSETSCEISPNGQFRTVYNIAEISLSINVSKVLYWMPNIICAKRGTLTTKCAFYRPTIGLFNAVLASGNGYIFRHRDLPKVKNVKNILRHFETSNPLWSPNLTFHKFFHKSQNNSYIYVPVDTWQYVCFKGAVIGFQHHIRRIYMTLGLVVMVAEKVFSFQILHTVFSV